MLLNVVKVLRKVKEIEFLSLFMMDRTANFYAQPSYARGAGMIPIYSGSRRQRGGNVLGALKSFFLPLIGDIGRRGAREAIGLTKDVVSDMWQGRSFKNSLKTQGLKRAKNLGREIASSMFSPPTPPTRKRVLKRRPTRKARQTAKRVKSNF